MAGRVGGGGAEGAQSTGEVMGGEGAEDKTVEGRRISIHTSTARV